MGLLEKGEEGEEIWRGGGALIEEAAFGGGGGSRK